MATFYLDPDGGNDSNNGLTFANRWKTITNGATAARTAPGDTIRIMGSPDATSMGQNGTWTDGPLQTTYAIVSSTNATPIVVTISAGNYTSMAPVVGDTLIVSGHTTNTRANGMWTISAVDGKNTITLVNADGTNSVGNGVGGATGTVRKFTNSVVKLAAPVTQNIAVCGNQGAKGSWTGVTNVTASVTTADFREGGESQSIAVLAGFTTGKAAYYATGTLNLSAYQQVSFWIKQTVGTLGAAGSVSLALCSDTLGATVVNTINIPALGALNQWSPIVVNLGTALGSAIQSIAFYVNTDNGAQTFLLDNIIACKAASLPDSLNLTSLISKNTGDEAWFGIQSINGTRIVLDGTTNTIPTGTTPQRGYAGTTETVMLYKLETIKTAMAASASAAVQTTQEAGTAGSLITYSGGWNRTDMSTQTGETWFDGQNGFGIGITQASAYTLLDKLNFTRYNTGISTTASDASIGSSKACNTTGSPFTSTSQRTNINLLSAVCCGGSISTGPGAIAQRIARADSCSATSSPGVALGVGSITYEVTQTSNNQTTALQTGTGAYVGKAYCYGGGGALYNPGSRSEIGYLVMDGKNTSNAVLPTAVSSIDWKVLGGYAQNYSNLFTFTNYSGVGYLRNFTITNNEGISSLAYADGRIHSENHDGVFGASKIFCDGGLIQTQESVVHGSATRAWKFSPTSAIRDVNYPLNHTFAKIACNANSLVTVSVWFQRDNTGLTGRLVCKGGQIAGVTSDVIATITSAANTWERLTITFTPTEKGVVELKAQFYGGTAYNGYISDATITQA